MLNTNNFPIRTYKVIGQSKLLFSYFDKKQIVALQNIKVILQKIKYSVQKFIEKIRSSNLKSLSWKELLSRVSNLFIKKKNLEIIPDGILGIHINQDSIVLAHVVLNKLDDIVVQEQTIFKLDSIDLNFQDADQNQRIIEILSNYIKDNNLSNIECSCVLSAQQYILSLIELPAEQDPAAKEKAILWSVKDDINYSIDDAMLDSFEIPANRAQDNATLGYAISIRKKLSKDIGGLLNSCGVRLKFIDIKELCIRNIITLYPELQQGVLLLEISTSNNNSILLLQNNALFVSRTTKLNIAELSNFDPKQDDDPTKLSIAENLILELQRSLDYSNGMFKSVNFGKMAIFPHNLNLDLFIAWAQDEIGLPICTINLADKMKFNQDITKEKQTDYALAIGAGLRNIEHVSAN